MLGPRGACGAVEEETEDDAFDASGFPPQRRRSGSVGNGGQAPAPQAPSWHVAVSYEQLLTILHQQHSLEMRHKEAEVAHLQARLEALEAGALSGEARTRMLAVQEALQARDEEAALQLAAKHKELELMSGLLQLRELQIEEFRRVCETQRGELELLHQQHEQLQQHQQQPRALEPVVAAAADEAPLYEEVSSIAFGAPAAVETSGLDEIGLEVAAAGDNGCGHANAASAAQEKLQQEVSRIRLRIEELEGAADEQRRRDADTARLLEEKTQRIAELEAGLRSLATSLPAPSAVAEATAAAAAIGSARHGVDAAAAIATGAAAAAEAQTPSHRTHVSQQPHDVRHLQGHCQAAWERLDGRGDARPNVATRWLEMSPNHMVLGSATASVATSHGSPRSALVKDAAGLQSQDLLREMARLRQQMGELERAAAVRSSSVAASAPSEPTAVSQAVPSASASLREPRIALASSNGGGFRNGRLSGWEYRPRAGDEMDEAIAAIVNRPTGRYYGMRALLCRLEPDIYLCGSRRMRLRVAESAGAAMLGDGATILASEDNGETWEDLEVAMAPQGGSGNASRGDLSLGSGSALADLSFGSARGGDGAAWSWRHRVSGATSWAAEPRPLAAA
eukprot:TRINITY_DN17754_c0_g1_i2.p1 TRINITY_DN17754_c0_g1~~TRINITY_DN17754_c0_g1_i2.p1  ORF type:complete len:624 (+),score=186.79 TRINITY_DN17754_c0_g1_i2:70-1941(+)